MDAKQLDGRRVALTGGARGIGLATAHMLSDAGARVVTGDLDATGEAEHLDVTDPDSYAAFLDTAAERLGGLDVLVNNAGIMPIGPLLDESDALARKVMEINVLGYMTGMKLALARMVSQGNGHIVNVASVAGKSPVPGAVSYCASKAAVIAMTETARAEHAGTGVHFTCVMPATTNTDLAAGTKPAKFVPMVEPEDVAKAIAKAIAKPRPDVYVPGNIPAILGLQSVLGRRARDRMNRALGIDRAFIDIDQEARAAYVKRLADAERT